MTFPTKGSGTELDPWLIEDSTAWLTVLRTSGSGGFYRLTTDVTGTPASITVSQGNLYTAKVIDGDGYTISVVMTISNGGCAMAGLHFRNCVIQVSAFGSGTRYVLLNCYATDCVILGRLYNTGTVYLFYRQSQGAPLIPQALTRVLLLPSESPSGQVTDNWYSFAGVEVVDCYVNKSGTNNTEFSNIGVTPTVAHLDAISDNSFSDNGWWQGEVHAVPWQSEVVTLTTQTLVQGFPSSRQIWAESEKRIHSLGMSDENGAAQALLRLRKRAAFTLFSSEDYGADDLYSGRVVEAGKWYLPPGGGDYVYLAGSGGRVIAVDSAAFSDQSVTIDGVIFTPRRRYQAAMSDRRSVVRNGAIQQVTLDTGGGGGGPVIEGDPAYLDGVVEEIHPMTGARQALSNCEVVAFERRGGDYVAMGSTYSDGIGGFRLETEVYGGGDVFAFAADFPGVIFQPGVPLNVGDRIRPALANGYVYEIVQPGTAGPAEPVWWPDQGGGTEGDIGTARARARPYYQPVGHGPLKMTLIE